MIGSLIVLMALAAPIAVPDSTEPTELTKRPDLIGREVVIDDRVRYFLESKRGQGFDELMLKRTEVVFRLPADLKFSRPPSEPNARVTGILKVEDRRWVFDVARIEMLPSDLDRLERDLVRLRPDDYLSRRAWAFWAERRGKELADARLEARGVVLEIEALWTEASRIDADNLGLAARSVGRPIPEPVRNALIHRGFRDRFSKAATSAEYDALARQVEASLPASADPRASAAVNSTWFDAYAKEPANAYRDAPEAVRAALDRKLLADIIERSIDRQLEARPIDAGTLAEVARDRLPDRPEIADRLRKRALIEAENRVASMRQSEVEELAKKFQALGEKERAERLIRAWLADRRKTRLSASDAEGRILLASNYEKMLDDRATAAELIREALVIDPESKSAVDAFKRMGFRKRGAEWFDPNSVNSNPSTPPDRAQRPDRVAAQAEGDSLKGLTRAQVRSRLGGKPDMIIRSASQGRCIEQWVYSNNQGRQVVRFLFEPGTTEPRASAYYFDQK